MGGGASTRWECLETMDDDAESRRMGRANRGGVVLGFRRGSRRGFTRREWAWVIVVASTFVVVVFTSK